MKERKFSFGKNWYSFLKTIDEERINIAIKSLKEMLEVNNLSGYSFLDIGCGSGLFSLAAVKIGAKVFSFDYDEESVYCAIKLREKYNIPPDLWEIEQGSIIDQNYINKLPLFDIVYAWGVLHHTGDLKKAIINAAYKTSPGGKFLVSIYNDQGILSHFWRKVKEIYCSSTLGKFLILTSFIPFLFMRSVLSGLLKHGNPLYQFINYKKLRGMSLYHDWIDWLGGYPFQTASPKEIENLLFSLGFKLKKSKLTSSWGCNEFLFIRDK